jgi:8-oxo-dGTP diphosphatase
MHDDSSMNKPRVRVVAALLWRGDDLLVQQRLPHKARPLLWEFPGGKVEPGESDAAALVRECREELDVEVRVGPLAWQTVHAYEDLLVELRVHHAHLVDADAEPRALCAAQVLWRRRVELGALEFCPADIALVAALVAGTVPEDA